MGRYMTVFIISFTFLFFINVSSVDSFYCKEYEDNLSSGFVICDSDKNHCFTYVKGDRNSGGCTSDTRVPGCYNNGIQTECFCNREYCNSEKRMLAVEECKYLKKSTGQDLKKIERIINESLCYNTFTRNMEKDGPVTEEAGIMTKEECDQFHIPAEQKCRKTFHDSQGSWTETVQCCCEGANCNDINPKDIQVDTAPPLKCHSDESKQYCHDGGAMENSHCLYQAAMYANGKLATNGTRCVDKNQCPSLKSEDDVKCKVMKIERDVITVSCCCKETECNTAERMKNELAKIEVPTKCQFYSSNYKHAKLSKWCASKTCLYTLVKYLDSHKLIEEEGHCKEDKECNPKEPCTFEVSGNEVIRITCCCTTDNCNTQNSAALDKPIKAIKVPHCLMSKNGNFDKDSIHRAYCRSKDQAVCRYHANMHANSKDPTAEEATCINTKCESLNPSYNDGEKCKIIISNSDVITVECCCKGTDCNTNEQMKNEAAKIKLPTKCYVYSNKEVKVSQFCASDTCSYTLKKFPDSNKLISEEGSCKGHNGEKCNTKAPCTFEVSDKEGKAVISITCCCNADNCNTQNSTALDKPIKDIKVPTTTTTTTTSSNPQEDEMPTLDSGKPQVDGAMSFFSQLVLATIIGVSVLIATIQHLHIGI